MSAFVHHFLFEFRSGIRNKNLLLMNYLFPLGFYLMMGLVMTQINPMFQEDIIPAMVIFSILSATLLGIPELLVTARENGVYRSYRINGIPSLSILLIPIFSTFFHLLIVSGLIVLSAPLLFDAPSPLYGGRFAIVFTAAAFSLACLSALIGVVASNSRMTVLWSQAIYLPSMLLGGMMVPFHMFPEAAGKVAQLLPAAQAMNAFNHLAMGKTADFSAWGSVLTLAISGLIALGLSLYLFRWDSKNTARRGHPLMALLYLLPFMISIAAQW